MGTFALDVNSNQQDIIAGLNYAISNLGTGNGVVGDVLTANITTGEITTTSTNSGGYSSTTIVSYLYQYMDVKYANTATGSSGFSSNCTLANYYGLRNTSNTAISSNPADYIWNQVTGGFGTTKALFYQTIGGRQIAFFAGNSAPSQYIPVIDDTPINLDQVSSVNSNQIVNVNAYFQSNTAPATPSGGTYDFTTLTLTPPSGWSATIPSFVANTSVYVSSAAFTGNTEQTAVPPTTTWTVPAVFTSQFQGNTGPAGERGFVPMGYVITPVNPTGASDATLTGWFSASRSNPSAPIGLGFTPIANDTAQFAYTDLISGNTITVVKQFDGTNWSSVVGTVISGGLFVPGSINANVLNANEVYSLTITGGNVTPGINSGSGFWMTANQGDAYLGGNTVIGSNLTIGNNASIGTNLTIGNSAVIGGNLTVQGLITSNVLNANTVATSQLVINSATQTISAADNLPYPRIQFVNGTTNNPTAAGYLWPYWTRGFAIGGGATIDPSTTGSADGSKIVVNYNAYIQNSGNVSNDPYNVVELWKSGSSNFYRNTFKTARTMANVGNSIATVDEFFICGDNGSVLVGNIGNITQQITGITSNLYDGYSPSFLQSSEAPYAAYGDNGVIVYDGSYLSPTVVSNLTAFYGASPSFNIYGISVIDTDAGATTYASILIVGSNGRIGLGLGKEYFDSANRYWQWENSGVFADLNDISADWTIDRDLTPAGTAINYVVVGTGGTLLYNSRTYNSTGNVSTSTGWNSAVTSTINNLNAIACNYTQTTETTGTRGNTWVAVGDFGTILRSSNFSGPWTAATTVPTTQNLYGVGYCNGVWTAVGAAGTILTSTDTNTWTGSIENPADGHIGSIGVRDLYGCAGGLTSNVFVISGQEIILTSNTNTIGSGVTWANAYLGGSSVNSSLTRLQYFGSWANVADTSVTPASQQITNGQVVSGTYTDIDYSAGTPVTYYLVLGNLKGNANIYTNSPNMTVTEYKR